eukprot:9046109-Pyramimonas_sp.AAC.1
MSKQRLHRPERDLVHRHRARGPAVADAVDVPAGLPGEDEQLLRVAAEPAGRPRPKRARPWL